jgi:thioredoxin-like negative regulator of GroEL
VLAKLYLQAEQYPEAVAQSKKALEIDPKDQAALYHLIQALRKTGRTSEIPELLKRLPSFVRTQRRKNGSSIAISLSKGTRKPSKYCVSAAFDLTFLLRLQ